MNPETKRRLKQVFSVCVCVSIFNGMLYIISRSRHDTIQNIEYSKYEPHVLYVKIPIKNAKYNVTKYNVTQNIVHENKKREVFYTILSYGLMIVVCIFICPIFCYIVYYKWKQNSQMNDNHSLALVDIQLG